MCTAEVKQQEVRVTNSHSSVPHAGEHKPSIGVLTVPHFTDYISLGKSLFPAIYIGDVHSGTEFMLRAEGQKNTRNLGRMLGKR